MSDASQDWTVALSGPLTTRASLLAGLAQTSGVEVDFPAELHHGHGLPDACDIVMQHIPSPDGSLDDDGNPVMVEMPMSQGRQDPTIGWILARTPDLDALADELTRAEWALRMHWPTPRCLACDGLAQVDGEDCGHCEGRGKTPVPFVPEAV